MDSQGEVVRRLLRRAGTTFAQEAGIRLRNQPMPLFQLLMLCLLASRPTVDTDMAGRAARELFASGLRTPHKVLAAELRTIISALRRGHYLRYDETVARVLVELAEAVQTDYRGDLRLLAERSGRDMDAATAALTTVPGIDDTAASTFLREVQDVWHWARSPLDDRALDAARELGLPRDTAELGKLSRGRNAALAAALARYSTNAEFRDRRVD